MNFSSAPPLPLYCISTATPLPLRHCHPIQHRIPLRLPFTPPNLHKEANNSTYSTYSTYSKTHTHPITLIAPLPHIHQPPPCLVPTTKSPQKSPPSLLPYPSSPSNSSPPKPCPVAKISMPASRGWRGLSARSSSPSPGAPAGLLLKSPSLSPKSVSVIWGSQPVSTLHVRI